MDQGLWLLRMVLVSAGTALASRGIGDAALWEAVAGAVLGLVGAAWSYFARKQALETPPPGMVDQLARLREAVGRQ